VNVTVQGDETENERHERVIRSMAERSDVCLLDMRARFGRELARLEVRGARQRSYLMLLATSNVVTALRREGKLTRGVAG